MIFEHLEILRKGKLYESIMLSVTHLFSWMLDEQLEIWWVTADKEGVKVRLDGSHT